MHCNISVVDFIALALLGLDDQRYVITGQRYALDACYIISQQSYGTTNAYEKLQELWPAAELLLGRD